MRIGAVAAQCGLPPKAIRYYESVGLIGPAERQANGYRLYNPDDVEKLRFLGRARGFGFSLEAMAELLRQHRSGSASCERVREMALAQAADAEQRIAELRALREMLLALVAECPGGTTDCCNILAALADKKAVPVLAAASDHGCC